MTGLRRLSRRRALATGLALAALPRLVRRSAAAGAYATVSYRSGTLRIAAYLYRPQGAGPFPLIIYNHGSREGKESRPVPWVRIAALYRNAGYAVLVPERRGYGGSDGMSWSEAVGRDHGSTFVDRCQEEAGDVLAALDYIATLPFVDRARLGIVGWSLGGIVTLFAIARSHAFRAAVDQAGGSLNWRRSPALQSALTAAARAATCPVLLMDAENDAAPEDIEQLADVMAKAGLPHESKMYRSFTPAGNPGGIAPGHLLFEAEGIPIWGQDAVAFFDAHLRS